MWWQWSVQLNFARANPYNGDKLHLEMNAEPLITHRPGKT